MLYAFFILNRRKDNSSFYLKKILEIYKHCEEKKLTLNCDFKTIQNKLRPDIHYVDFFGVYNDPQILKEEI
jgi:hypothetical protein